MPVCLKKLLVALTIGSSCLAILPAVADGGISIKGTRIIYPADAQQENLSVYNSSKTDSFLVQSWTEDAQGKKTQDFVVTPPLYLSGPKNENKLRLMKVADNLPKDRETLYYFITKAIPPVEDKDVSKKSVMRISAASRIKLFVRPAGLKPAPEKAAEQLSFKIKGKQLEITNPGPYFITLKNIRSGKAAIGGVMVTPKQKTIIPLPANTGHSITFNTINDYGSVSKPLTLPVE